MNSKTVHAYIAVARARYRRLRIRRSESTARDDVWITPYVSLTSDDLTTSEKQTRDQIACALGHYQELMVQHHEQSNPMIGRLQMIDAYWNPGTNELRVHGRGDRFFSWQGTLNQFIGLEINTTVVQMLITSGWKA